ncbi:MAG: cytochrome c3 family protein, partial [bacterium]|nr:cytochrome c3 family protein [bacterium]
MKRNINNLIILVGLVFLIVGCKDSTTGIKFNHQAHLDRGLTCEFCHTQYMTEARAGLPSMAICANCHSINTTKPSEKCQLCHTEPKQKVKPLVPAIYQRVIFSHKVHTQEEQLACDQCHPGIGKSKRITGTQIPKMESCSDCH